MTHTNAHTDTHTHSLTHKKQIKSLLKLLEIFLKQLIQLLQRGAVVFVLMLYVAVRWEISMSGFRCFVSVVMCESNVPPDDGFKMTTRQQEFLTVEINRGKFSLEVKLLKLLSVF